MRTVGDIRRAIMELPDDAPVLLKSEYGEWPDVRAIDAINPGWDGRFESCLLLTIGGFVEKWNSPEHVSRAQKRAENHEGRFRKTS